MEKKVLKNVLGAVAAAVILAASGSYLFCHYQSSRYHIVKLKGTPVAMNYAHLYWPGSCIVGDDAHSPVTLLWDRDQFLADNADMNLSLVSTYSWTDGDDLSFQLKDFVLYLAGKPVGITIDEKRQEKAWEWLRRAGAKDVKSLRFLNFEGSNITFQDVLLKKLGALNPHIGLALDSDYLARVLPFFKPRVLYLNVSLDLTEEQIKLLSGQARLQTLNLSGMDAGDEKNTIFLSRLFSLRRLTVNNSEIETFPALPKSLRALSFSNCTIKDLASLKGYSHLRELSFHACALGDIKPLSGLKGLVSIGFPETEASDLSALNSLRRLRTIVTPKGISQESLIALLRSHPDLQILHLESPAIKDLEPLKQLHSLKALLLTAAKKEDTGFLKVRELYGLAGLRYLALDEEFFADGKERLELEKALPNCQIALVRSVCLGSGWILVFLPIIFISIGVNAYRGKRRPARTSA